MQNKEKITRDEQGYNKYNHIKQISLSGLMVGLAILVGFFGFFPLGGGNVYLLAAVVFLFPIILRLPYALLSTVASLLVVDALTGYIAFTWISLLAYIGAVLIIWVFLKIKKIWIIFFALITSSAYLIVVYLGLEVLVFGRAYALKDAIATSIQMAIIVPIVITLYFPLKKILPKIK